jgi:hypothetical protein
VEIRASKSKKNKQEMAKKRYKQAKKVFPISLGAGCRRFESCHSDHLSSKNRLLGGFSALKVCFLASLGHIQTVVREVKWRLYPWNGRMPKTAKSLTNP